MTCPRPDNEACTSCYGRFGAGNGEIVLRHPDCPVHTGPVRCREHGGVDVGWQCQEAMCIARWWETPDCPRDDSCTDGTCCGFCPNCPCEERPECG
jgi:hypothetical protein